MREIANYPDFVKKMRETTTGQFKEKSAGTSNYTELCQKVREIANYPDFVINTGKHQVN